MRDFFAATKNYFLPGILGACVLLAIAAGLAGCSPAESQSVTDTVSWQNPDTREDGSNLTDLATIRIQWGQQGGPYNEGSLEVGAEGLEGSTQVVEIDRPNVPGTRCYSAVAIDANGVNSAPSDEACKTIIARISPPANLTVD